MSIKMGPGSNSPPQTRRGGRDINENIAKPPLILLTSTTPAAATASAFPSSAEEGSCLTLKLRETYKVSTIRGGIKT